MPTRVLVFASDQHAGSNFGLLHPDGVPLDDGPHVMPSKLQLWLWEKHEQFRADVESIIESEPDCTAHYFNNGDLCDGWHHRTHQTISVDQGVHVEAAAQVLEKGILKIDFDSIHMTRGTPAHVGKAAGLEKSVAARLNRHKYPIVRDPKTDSFVWPFIYTEFQGILFDIRHHGKTGQLQRTLKSYAALSADEIHRIHVNQGLAPPDIAIRAHRHTYVDSGPDHRGVTRLISMPCWQGVGSEWVRSKAIESLPSIGGVVIVVRNGDYQIKPLLYEPDPEPQRIWRPS